MSASPAHVPALPTFDDAIDRALTDRPNFDELSRHLSQISGRELFELGSLGESSLQEIAEIDLRAKNFLSRFSEWCRSKANPFMLHIAIVNDYNRRRLALENSAKDLRQRCSVIQGQFMAAKKAAADAEARRIQEEDRRKKEAEKQAALLALKAEPAHEETVAEIARIEAAPITVATVSKEQASAGLPETPKGWSGRTVYVRRVVDAKAFWTWLGQHPEEATTLGLEPNFTKYKNNPDKAIPGVVMEEKIETSHRSR